MPFALARVCKHKLTHAQTRTRRTQGCCPAPPTLPALLPQRAGGGDGSSPGNGPHRLAWLRAAQQTCIDIDMFTRRECKGAELADALSRLSRTASPVRTDAAMTTVGDRGKRRTPLGHSQVDGNEVADQVSHQGATRVRRETRRQHNRKWSCKHTTSSRSRRRRRRRHH